jgi:beta-alanine degradation protein BauB
MNAVRVIVSGVGVAALAGCCSHMENAGNGPQYPDVVAAAPGNALVEYEDDRVRVVRLTVKPGEVVPMHTHPDRVIVYLTAVTVEITTPDGQSGIGEVAAGKVGFSPAVVHAGRNTSQKTWEIVEMELKQKK